EVLELERLPQIAATYQRHNGLQVIAGFTGHTNFFTLDLRLNLQLAVLDELNDLLLNRALNTLLQFGFDKPVFTAMHKLVWYIQRGAFNAAFKQLGAQNIQQLVNLEIRFAQDLNGLIRIVQLESGLNATKVET